MNSKYFGRLRTKPKLHRSFKFPVTVFRFTFYYILKVLSGKKNPFSRRRLVSLGTWMSVVGPTKLH